MADLPARLVLAVSLLIPFLLFMAWIYLLLHIVFARVLLRRDSPVLWFFGVVTGPLTRPVRAVLPLGTPEPRVRVMALVVYAGLWLVARILLAPAGAAFRG